MHHLRKNEVDFHRVPHLENKMYVTLVWAINEAREPSERKHHIWGVMKCFIPSEKKTFSNAWDSLCLETQRLLVLFSQRGTFHVWASKTNNQLYTQLRSGESKRWCWVRQAVDRCFWPQPYQHLSAWVFFSLWPAHSLVPQSWDFTQQIKMSKCLWSWIEERAIPLIPRRPELRSCALKPIMFSPTPSLPQGSQVTSDL